MALVGARFHAQRASRAVHSPVVAIHIGKTERRLALAILVTALLPLLAAIVLASSLFRQASAVWFNPEIGEQLDRGVSLYKDYVKAIKEDMRHQTDAIASDEAIVEAAAQKNTARLEARLREVFEHFPELVSVVVEGNDGAVIGKHTRGRPVEASHERSLEVRHPLGSEGDTRAIVATFAVDRARLDELEIAGAIARKYHTLESSRAQLTQPYMFAFAAVLGLTMVLTLVLGTLLARGVTRRINRLALAITLVADGDLSVRVPVTGSDELTELAKTFNRMLGEMSQSRARIEFLQRMGAWQEMAQRLAHEIKNPLTPIQLAVQECHRKYAGDDVKYRALLDTTLEIVEEEVATLRRLVGNFSRFARLPTAELKEASLRDFLRECSEQLAHLADPGADAEADEDAALPFDVRDSRRESPVRITWALPSDALVASFDRHMLRRVIVNLVRNAVQAIRDADASSPGHVVVSATRSNGAIELEVADDGPGIPPEHLMRVFDPYFTTKGDGTGLGLAIVKKIIVEHGGAIRAGKSAALGGASFIVSLPDALAQSVSLELTARHRASFAELRREGEV